MSSVSYYFLGHTKKQINKNLVMVLLFMEKNNSIGTKYSPKKKGTK